jgi:hypothetical protein
MTGTVVFWRKGDTRPRRTHVPRRIPPVQGSTMGEQGRSQVLTTSTKERRIARLLAIVAAKAACAVPAGCGMDGADCPDPQDVF